MENSIQGHDPPPFYGKKLDYFLRTFWKQDQKSIDLALETNKKKQKKQKKKQKKQEKQ